jgi:8-oxo-dGTP diphosphatase
MEYKNPIPTVDIIIYKKNTIILIKRNNDPIGWALPGGFIDEGERVDQAAIREAKEETNLSVELIDLLSVYSDPKRDPRKHTMSVVFTAEAVGDPVAGDDAVLANYFQLDDLPGPIVFDHQQIIDDFIHFRQTGKRPRF